MRWISRILLWLTLPLPAAVADDAEMSGYLVHAGRARCVVVLPDEATAVEQYAAQEFCVHVRLITGVELPLVRESERARSPGPAVNVGRTMRGRNSVPDEKLRTLGDDGYMVFAKEGDLFLVGGARRGVLYGVHECLELMGVRWYAPDYAVIPRRPDLLMPATPRTFVPRLWYRDQWWNNRPTNEWLARMRINGSNGQNHSLPPEMGGSAITVHEVHSLKEIVPPDEFYETRREWFAVKENGQRDRKYEMCLTDPTLRAQVAGKVLADLRARGGKVDNYWVSQNDGGRSGCFCERCTAERVAHGDKERWSANIIVFVNHVADHVRAEFPHVRIKTLAYSYTQKAPDNLQAADNVLVELCGNFRRAADDPHRELVKTWSQVARNLSVYTYGGSNYGYWWPYPNIEEIGSQPVLALESGVTAFYLQGTALGAGAGLADLKAYVSARMAWDPSRDIKQVLREFCEGFYGPGGRYVVEYVQWYSDYIGCHGMKLDGGWGDAERWREWVTKEAVDHCDALFRHAIEATKDQPVYLRHVRRAYLEVLCGGVMINLQPKASMLDQELKLVEGADADAVKAKAKLFGEIMRENGYDKWAEHAAFDPTKYPH